MVDDGDAAAAAQVKAHAETRIGGMLDQLDAQLASHGREWLLGASYTAVDPFAMLLCRWTRGFSRPARSLPHSGLTCSECWRGLPCTRVRDRATGTAARLAWLSARVLREGSAWAGTILND